MYAEAEAMYRQSQLHETMFGKDDPRTLASKITLANRFAASSSTYLNITRYVVEM